MGQQDVFCTVLCFTVLALTCSGSSSWTRSSRQASENTPPPEGGCVLPELPESASYNSPVCQFNNKSTVCKNVPGTTVPESWLLRFKCNEGYYPNEGESSLLVFCVAGNWTPSIPVCKKMCPPVESSSRVDVHCQYTGDFIDCSKPVPSGTEAKGRCRPFHEPKLNGRNRQQLVCRENGQWSDGLVNCEPVCGKKVKTETLIGLDEREPVLPWFVGIYRKYTNNQMDQICGGTLISPHIVLTAAHCVFSEYTKQLVSPSEIYVALGKSFREWTHYETGQITTSVRAIAISPLYLGSATGYAHDVALLDLTHSVKMSPIIMSACVDWNRESTVTPGQLGTLAGWGRTENRTISDIVSELQLSYLDTIRCLSDAPTEAKRLITSDKFCSVTTSGANIGLSGVGLTFERNGIHYVQGVLSTKLRDDPTIVTFTNLGNAEVLTWLEDTKRSFEDQHIET